MTEPIPVNAADVAAVIETDRAFRGSANTQPPDVYIAWAVLLDPELPQPIIATARPTGGTTCSH